MTTSPIGFIGLGNMGSPMVRCLAKAGYAVVAYDIRSGIAAALAEEAAAGGKIRAAASLPRMFSGWVAGRLLANL